MTCLTHVQCTDLPPVLTMFSAMTYQFWQCSVQWCANSDTRPVQWLTTSYDTCTVHWLTTGSDTCSLQWLTTSSDTCWVQWLTSSDNVQCNGMPVQTHVLHSDVPVLTHIQWNDLPVQTHVRRSDMPVLTHAQCSDLPVQSQESLSPIPADQHQWQNHDCGCDPQSSAAVALHLSPPLLHTCPCVTCTNIPLTLYQQLKATTKNQSHWEF